MYNPDIGIRAFEAVRQMARRRGTTISKEVERLGLYQPQVYRWRSRQAPNAANLELLCRAGYDVVWILTGEVRDDGRQGTAEPGATDSDPDRPADR